MPISFVILNRDNFCIMTIFSVGCSVFAESKERIAANLANFAYDPYNYSFLRQVWYAIPLCTFKLNCKLMFAEHRHTLITVVCETAQCFGTIP